MKLGPAKFDMIMVMLPDLKTATGATQIFDQRMVDDWVLQYARLDKETGQHDRLLQLGPVGLPALFVALDHLSGFPRYKVMELIEEVVRQNREQARTSLQWARRHRPLILGQTRAFLIYCWGQTLGQLKKTDLSEIFSWFEDRNALVRRTVLQVLNQHADASYAQELAAFLHVAARDADPQVRARALRLGRRLGLNVQTPWFLKLQQQVLRPAAEPENSLSIFS